MHRRLRVDVTLGLDRQQHLHLDSPSCNNLLFLESATSPMAEDQEGEVLFRPTHKRRKVLRKRLNSDDEDTVPTPLSTHAIVETLETDSNEPAHRRATIVQARKKGAVGRGITFSAADAQRRAAQEPKEQALVLASEHQEADAPQIERFVKPTGKAEVKEDKHMYVCHVVRGILPNSADETGWHT